MFGSMILISYAMYVYSNVMTSPYNLFFQVNIVKNSIYAHPRI